MPLLLDRDATILEIDGDQLVILSPREATDTPRERRTVAIAVAGGREQPPTRSRDASEVGEAGDVVETVNAVQSTEDRRFADRRAAVEEEHFTSRRRRRGRMVAAVVVLAGAGLGIGASPLLRVQHVHVVGVQSLNRQVVEQEVNAAEHPSMLTLKARDIEARLNALPLVNDARVWKQWPDTLVIEIAERFPVATAQSAQGWVVMDQHGNELERRQARPDLPQLVIDPTQVAQTSVGADRAPDEVQQLLRVAIGSSARLRQQIDVMEIRNDGVEIRLRPGVIANDDLVIRFGHVDDIEAKLRALETMLDPATKAQLTGISVLDLTVADQPALMPPTTLAPAPEVPESSIEAANGDVPNGAVPIADQQETASVEAPIKQDATRDGAPGSNLEQ